jgi:hypothetical protein
MSDYHGENPELENIYSNSIGWLSIFRDFERVIKLRPDIQEKVHAAKIAFDLGSEMGQSAYALSLLCPNLQKIYCVDNNRPLGTPFKNKLVNIVEEKIMPMQHFVKETVVKGGPFADVIMLASLEGQPFFEDTDFRNLSGSIDSGGLIFEINSDYKLANQTSMTYFFHQVVNNPSVIIWQRNDVLV